MSSILKRIVVLATAVAALAFAGSRIGGWKGFVLAAFGIVVGVVLTSKLGDEMRRTFRRGATRLRRPTYSYDLLVRLSSARIPAVDDVIREIQAFIKDKSEGRIGIRGTNYVHAHMASPPEPISVEWHMSGDADDADETEPEGSHEVVAPCVILVAPAAPHVVGLRDLRGPRTQELATVLWDLGSRLQHAFDGSQPNILITINRVASGRSPARPSPPSAPRTEVRTNGASVVRGTDGLQISATNISDAIRHLADDIVGP